MQWHDEAIVLTVRRFGETAAIASLFTREHGRHSGLVRGGASRRLAGVLQPGNQVAAAWRGRLDEQLGQFRLELTQARAAQVMDEPPRLAALSSLTALLATALPERAPQPALFEASALLLDGLASESSWTALYVRWELGLLAELGFGLDLTRCAVTGTDADLAYVSPRTGRAVAAEAGRPYAERLLPLPSFLAAGRGTPPANDAGRDVADGLRLTGFFLARALLAQGGHLPPARERLRLWLEGEALPPPGPLPAPPGGVKPLP